MYDHIYSQSPYGLCLCRCLCVSVSLAADLCPSFYKKNNLLSMLYAHNCLSSTF